LEIATLLLYLLTRRFLEAVMKSFDVALDVAFDVALGEGVETTDRPRPKSALEFLQSKYQDSWEEPETRIKCAIAALPFESPALAVENHHVHGALEVCLRFVREATAEIERLRAQGKTISFNRRLPGGAVEHSLGELSPVVRKR
jgi:hypothetical protein